MVRIRNLDFGYSRRVPLFQNLNLSLDRGHIYGLLGKNGAGKTTLLKNIVGLAFPWTGTCLIDEQPASARRPEVLEDLFFLPEEVYAPALTAEQFVAHTAGFYPRFNAEQLYEYLQELEVPRGAKLNKFSHGQQKKFMIAFALAANTGLLVLDEPTNGLDIPSKVQFRKILASALSEERCMVISTHQVRDLESLIDTVVVVHNREIVLNEEIDQLAERLTFATGPEAEAPGAFHTGMSVRGPVAIRPNDTGAYSRVDLELLFNALTDANAAKLYSYLNQPSHASVQ
ncbi:ABC transporter ATP-binding protein [Hymenobacter convexus]|uniref:ABC transporter ATP-binding protein n=1 Tax=Hymenobacter sp. CA1UV-4 TaxID=3063782 RepID=UPI002713BA29|nr:ABC transporter ATP-binding protein [Hymenobacter sp. CA1UV-4]MDO7852854.1 ABC transporter ATP-binding protein [Hymenobacter sp. CA1UV-4]